MEMPAVAAAFWERVSRLEPGRLEAVDGRARALRELGRFDAAVEILRAGLMRHPERAAAWAALGVTLTQDGRADEALVFLDEAVRLDPSLAGALYNRANAHFDLGDLEGAPRRLRRSRCGHARPGRKAAVIAFAQATLALARGDLARGWDGYEARFAPAWPRAVAFDAPGRHLADGDDLAGRRLLVVAEQGLGDELMFANVLPDVARRPRPRRPPEPRGRAARWSALFRRSFPGADVSAHATGRGARVACGARPTSPTRRGSSSGRPWAPCPRASAEASPISRTVPAI